MIAEVKFRASVPGIELNDRCAEILALIALSIETRGYPPTVRELGKKMGGLKPGEGLNYPLNKLAELGVISGLHGVRQIRILKPIKLEALTYSPG